LKVQKNGIFFTDPKLLDMFGNFMLPSVEQKPTIFKYCHPVTPRKLQSS